MLCPEIWNFKAPASNFKVEKGDVSENSCSNKINNFYFNHLVSVTVPDTLSTPKSVNDILLNDCEYYKICNLKISEFVNDTFITNFSRCGTLISLSIGTKIDCDNCFCITPSKKLLLSLTKEAFQSTGLEGSVSYFCTNNKYKYIVKIDLTELSPATKSFQRIKDCLDRLHTFDIILIWEPADAQICPSSIAKYFDNLDYEVKQCSPKYEVNTRYSVKAPVIDFINSDEDTCADYTEWLGILSLNGDLENESPPGYISSYQVPEPSTSFGQMKTLVWAGFFSSHKIKLLFHELRKYQQENDKPWISLYVQGFSDSPVNWGEREHHYYTNGDNSYTFFINSTNYIACSSMCSNKLYKKKYKK